MWFLLLICFILFWAVFKAAGWLDNKNSNEDFEIRNGSAETNPVIRGHIYEQEVPVLNWPEDLRDARFLGGPVDYVVFKNCSKGGPVEILFVEVKSGTSNLTEREELVKEAVLNKRVRWVEIRPSEIAQSA